MLLAERWEVTDFIAKTISAFTLAGDEKAGTLIYFYKHNNYKDTYGKKCEKISIINLKHNATVDL